MLLTTIVLLPVLAAGALLGLRRLPDRGVGRIWVLVTTVDLALVAWMWAGFDSDASGGGCVEGLQYEGKVRWKPTVDASYHVGVDGTSTPWIALTTRLCLCAAIE